MKQDSIYKQYCQSCGMPLRFDMEEYLGTNADRSRSHEYCYYCLKDGEYIVDIPMEEMIDIWVKYTDKYNDYSGTRYSPSELRTILNKRLPALKRWKQKEVTLDIHAEAVAKAKVFINKNLFTPIDLKRLCESVNLSFFHFRRIFKESTGENIGSYIQRLRLERIAHTLIFTHLPMHDILKQSHYQTRFSLSKAFKKHFGLSMSNYRKHHQRITATEPITPADTPPLPEIRKLTRQQALCLPVGSAFLNKELYRNVWKQLSQCKEQSLATEEKSNFLSISMDNPIITPQKQCRFYLGFFIAQAVESNKQFYIQEIPEGTYAVFRHQGEYSLLQDTYRFIYNEWLPQNGYCQEHPMSFEVYLNTPKDTDKSELLTEVYIPVKKY